MNIELVVVEQYVADAMIGCHVRTKAGYVGEIVRARPHNFTLSTERGLVKQTWGHIEAIQEWGMTL